MLVFSGSAVQPVAQRLDTSIKLNNPPDILTQLELIHLRFMAFPSSGKLNMNTQ
ncbi:hypothetical protein PM8797T_03604 [Gimesia maris DSM 8797]|nr:hypothetical protein PM8797T_03604 [Gimesia maris DSM 8797]